MFEVDLPPWKAWRLFTLTRVSWADPAGELARISGASARGRLGSPWASCPVLPLARRQPGCRQEPVGSLSGLGQVAEVGRWERHLEGCWACGAEGRGQTPVEGMAEAAQGPQGSGCPATGGPSNLAPMARRPTLLGLTDELWEGHLIPSHGQDLGTVAFPL